MKSLITLVAAGALLIPSFVPPAFAHEKPLPPAFGKELVPDEESQERNEPKAAEIEEEKTQTHPRPAVHMAPHQMRGKKLHIELDGDEDGGGGGGVGDDDEDDDDGGEF